MVQQFLVSELQIAWQQNLEEQRLLINISKQEKMKNNLDPFTSEEKAGEQTEIPNTCTSCEG